MLSREKKRNSKRTKVKAIPGALLGIPTRIGGHPIFRKKIQRGGKTRPITEQNPKKGTATCRPS